MNILDTIDNDIDMKPQHDQELQNHFTFMQKFANLFVSETEYGLYF